MLEAKAVAENGLLSQDTIRKTLERGLAQKFDDGKLLVLIPDHTRSLPLPFLFRSLVDILRKTKQLDFMVALGTHPRLSEESIHKLVGITAEERATTFKHIGLLNHEWNTPSALISLGIMDQDEIKHISVDHWDPSLPDEVNVRINKAALEYDHILILGPT